MVGHKAALPPTPASTLTHSHQLISSAHLTCFPRQATRTHLWMRCGCMALQFGIELPKESSSPPLQLEIAFLWTPP